MRRFCNVLGGMLLLGLVFSSTGYSAGFAIIEQGVKGLGNAYAGGAAAAEDATTVFFNPAGMTLIQGQQVVAAAHLIVPKSDFSGSGSTATGVSLAGPDQLDGGVSVVVGNLYYVYNPGGKWAFGLGINSPFGLITEWDDDWVGRYHAQRSEVVTVNINPSVAYRVNDHLSIGGGVSAQYIDAELSSAVDFGSVAFSQSGGAIGSPGDPTQDGKSNLKADDWGYGFNLGALIEFNSNTRLGLAYRSKIAYTLEGDADFSVPATISGLPAPLGPGIAGLFADTDAQADITLPASASISVFHRYNEKFAVMADVTWTDWSRFDELRVEFDQNTNGATLPDNVTDESWEDSWRYSVGLTYSPASVLDLRFGLAFDETPIPDAEHRTPRIPGEDRIWTAFGAGYQFNDAVSLDFAYAHLFVKDSDIRHIVTGSSSSSEQARGNLVGEFENSVDIASLQFNYSF